MPDDQPTHTPTLPPPTATDAPQIGPPRLDAPPLRAADLRRLSILGIPITDVTRPRAIELLEEMIRRRDGHARSVFFVNAHTLNLAAADREFHKVLGSAEYVFGDGTGVRWAARLQGVHLRDNLVGTDLVPTLFETTADRGYRYFLLGADEDSIFRAAQFAAAKYTGWTQAGYHHGYVNTPELSDGIVRRINDSRADVLLVGQGNPIQERWIHAHQHKLNVPLCMAVGGLFNYWAGDIRRAPAWLRRRGAEWLGILWQQPHKARRYLLGNPLFIGRVARQWWNDRDPGKYGLTEIRGAD